MKQKIIWQCGYCRKTYVQKSKIIKHEEICIYNPVNKCCATCLYYGHFEDDFERIYKDCCWFGKILTNEPDVSEKNRMTYRRNCENWINKTEVIL